MKPFVAMMTMIPILLCSCTATRHGEPSAAERVSIEVPAGVAVPALGSVF